MPARNWFAVFVLTIFGASAVVGEVKQSALERGFAPDKLYQFADVDSIDLSSGTVAEDPDRPPLPRRREPSLRSDSDLVVQPVGLRTARDRVGVRRAAARVLSDRLHPGVPQHGEQRRSRVDALDGAPGHPRHRQQPPRERLGVHLPGRQPAPVLLQPAPLGSRHLDLRRAVHVFLHPRRQLPAHEVPHRRRYRPRGAARRRHDLHLQHLVSAGGSHGLAPDLDPRSVRQSGDGHLPDGDQ